MIESSFQEPREPNLFLTTGCRASKIHRLTDRARLRRCDSASESEAGYEFWAVAETKQTRSYRSC